MCEVLVAVVWVACAVGGMGYSFADFQGRYPEHAYHNRGGNYAVSAWVGFAGGPMGLLIAYTMSNFGQHGWTLTAKSDEESWAAYQKRYPTLSRGDYER